MKNLPKEFCIKRDENNPLWWKFRDWCNERSGNEWNFYLSEYYGFLKSSLCGDVEPFAAEITLEEWNEAVNGWMPEYMEEIEVWDDECTNKRVRKFITYIDGIDYPWIIIDGFDEINQHKHARPINYKLKEEIAELEKQLAEKRKEYENRK